MRGRVGSLSQGRETVHGTFKSGFLIESRKSGGDVAGPSPIWLKLGVVSRLDPKPPKMTLFYVVRPVGGDLEGSLAQRGEKM